MLFLLIFLLVICEGAKIPIELTREITSPEKLTLETSNPNQLSSINPRFFLYNILQVDPDRPIPLIHYPYGRPGNSYVTSSFNYYGAPLYTYDIFTYRPLVPSIPSYIPQQPITTTQRPSNNNNNNNNDDDNIEKLDDKLDPNLEMNPNDESEDDSVVIEALD